MTAADDVDAELEIELSPGALYRAPTSSFVGALLVAAIGLTLAVVLERPAMVAVAGPSLLWAALGLTFGHYRQPAVSAALEAPRVLEGETTRLRFTLASPVDLPLVEVELDDAADFDLVGAHRHVITLRADQPHVVTFAVIPRNWGVLDLPVITVRARTSGGLFTATVAHRCTGSLRVHLNEEPVSALLSPHAYRRIVGAHLSTESGDGCEIADNRPYRPGDQLRAINWRISARAEEPWVTLRHPDRSTTAVIIVDAFAAYGTGGADTLRRSIRAAGGLARVHLATHDPVGLLLVGHGRRWIAPRLGRAQLATMTDALLELSRPGWGERSDRRVGVDRLVPGDSVVIAVSPLLNDAFGALLQPLLARGQEVHVIEPVYVPPAEPQSAGLVGDHAAIWADGASADDWSDDGDSTLARRVFAIEQHLRRRAMTDIGATVTQWDDETLGSMLVALARAQGLRRRRRPVPR